MQALEIARSWYENILNPHLAEEFPAERSRIAVAMAGRGSECFGFDDDISRDHDHIIGVMLLLTEDDERKFGFPLERFYRRMRKEFPPATAVSAASRCGDLEHGVTIIGDFYRRHLGITAAPQSLEQWLYIPEYALAEAVNGEVFCDELGEFTRIRHSLLHDMPEDVRKKKLAARAAVMAQSGQYNFMRCIKHGEPGAAALALGEFVRTAISMIFLLNKRYAPYYKWSFRAMRQLPKLSEQADSLTALLLNTTAPENQAQNIEAIAGAIIAELQRQNLTDSASDYLEDHAFSIMQTIRDRKLRTLHVMEG